MDKSLTFIDPADRESLLLQQTAGGNEEAYTLLYKQYSGKVYEVAFAYLRDSDEAKEAVQEVFIRIWDKRESLGRVQQFKDYLFIVTRNHIFDQFKRRAVVSGLHKKYVTSNLHMHAPSTDQKVMQSQCEAVLRQAVEQLPPGRKKVYQLRQAGLSYEEIAHRLHISRFTVKNQVKAALDFIRAYVTIHWYGSLLFISALQVLAVASALS